MGIWDKHAIKAEIHRRGKTLAAVAEEAGLEVSACSVALKKRWKRGEKAIADFLRVPAHVLWPDRYPRRLTRRPVNGAAAGGASQKSSGGHRG